MTAERSSSARIGVAVAVGLLIGFIGGYFAGGGGRPSAAPAAASARPGDREATLRQSIDRDPENPKLLGELGNLLYDRDDWDGAIAAYEKARRKAPSDPNLLSDLGVAHRERGEFRLAEACFKKARDADPDHWQSLVNLTLLAAFDTRNRVEAERHLAELKRRFPGIPSLARIEQQIASLPAKS